MAIKCDACRVNDAVVKDYRYNGNVYDKCIVCPTCFRPDDVWFFKIKYAKKGISKKRVMSQIIDGRWKDYLYEKP